MKAKQQTLEGWHHPKASDQAKQQNRNVHKHNDQTHSHPHNTTYTNNRYIQTEINLQANPNEIQVQVPANTSLYDKWGHPFGQKPDSAIRVVFRNISSLPKEKHITKMIY
jgi:phage/plasmid-associated DNA primase